MNNFLFNKANILICTLLTAATCLTPISKVEARGEGTAFAAAGLGALVGAAIASDAHHHRQRNHQRNVYRVRNCVASQQQTMNYILMNYNPAFHDAWVRYVVVDCAYILNPVQQDQMLSIMDQRRSEMGFTSHVPVHTR